MVIVSSGMVLSHQIKAMISDPIFIGSDNGLLKQHIGQTIFMASKRKLRYAIISSADRKNISMSDWWMIDKSAVKGQTFYYLNGIGKNYFIPAEMFFDNLKERYPDHFEWILFHPEWLK